VAPARVLHEEAAEACDDVDLEIEFYTAVTAADWGLLNRHVRVVGMCVRTVPPLSLVTGMLLACRLTPVSVKCNL